MLSRGRELRHVFEALRKIPAINQKNLGQFLCLKTKFSYTVAVIS